MRKRGTRERTCCDCGHVETVRQDNKSDRCRSCSAKIAGAKGLLTIKAAANDNRVILTCSCCSKTFARTSGKASRSKLNYCSMDCRRKHKKVERVCKFCGVTFETIVSKITSTTNSSANFCSRPCYEKYLCRTDRTSGRGSQWRKISAQVKSEFPFCGWCGSVKRTLQVHHIVPFRLTQDNSRRNLIPLCCKCHKHVELATVDAESTGIKPTQLFEVMSMILRPRQAAAAALLKTIANDNIRLTRIA